MAGSILSIFDHTKIALCMGVSLAEAERFIDAVAYSGPSDEDDADRAQRLIDGVNEVIGGKAPAAVAAKVRGQLAREIALRGDVVAPVAPPMGEALETTKEATAKKVKARALPPPPTPTPETKPETE